MKIVASSSNFMQQSKGKLQFHLPDGLRNLNNEAPNKSTAFKVCLQLAAYIEEH